MKEQAHTRANEWIENNAVPCNSTKTTDEYKSSEPETRQRTCANTCEEGSKTETEQSFRNLWHEFNSATSMHGLKHAGGIQKSKLRRVLWMIALTVMMSMLTYTAYGLFKQYFNYKTMSTPTIELVQELPFPAVTFCNLSPYKRSAMKSPKMDFYFLQMSLLHGRVPAMNFSDPENSMFNEPISEDWLQNVSFSVSDLFAEGCIDINGMPVLCESYVTPTITEWGICYTVNSYDYIKENGVQMTSTTGSSLALTVNLKVNQSEYIYSKNLAAGIKFIIHDYKEEPDVANEGFFSSPGFSSYASLQLHKYKHLPYPYKSSGDDYCVDTKDSNFKHSLKYHTFYSHSACMKECKANYIINRCGCKAPTDLGNTTLCSLAQISQCYRIANNDYRRSKAIQSTCDCPRPCEYNVYKASVTTSYFPANIYHPKLHSMGYKELRQNFLEVTVFFDSMSYVKIENVAECTVQKIIGTLGGEMGIFLGASLLTLSEFAEFTFLAAYVLVKKITKADKKCR